MKCINKTKLKNYMWVVNQSTELNFKMCKQAKKTFKDSRRCGHDEESIHLGSSICCVDWGGG